MNRVLTLHVGPVIAKVAAVIAALVVASAVLVSPTPAAAAAPPQHIWNELTGKCLAQVFYGSTPTTEVGGYYLCDQQWRLEPMGGNTYRIVNASSGWCLSGPNGKGSRVFAEICVSAFKQLWTPTATGAGNLLVNEAWKSCLHTVVNTDPYQLDELWLSKCYGDDLTQRWYWS